MAPFCGMFLYLVTFFTDSRLLFSVLMVLFKGHIFFCLLFCRLFVVNPDYSYLGFSSERAFPASETSASSANNVHVYLGLHLFNKYHSGM